MTEREARDVSKSPLGLAVSQAQFVSIFELGLDIQVTAVYGILDQLGRSDRLFQRECLHRPCQTEVFLSSIQLPLPHCSDCGVSIQVGHTLSYLKEENKNVYKVCTFISSSL